MIVVDICTHMLAVISKYYWRLNQHCLVEWLLESHQLLITCWWVWPNHQLSQAGELIILGEGVTVSKKILDIQYSYAHVAIVELWCTLKSKHGQNNCRKCMTEKREIVLAIGCSQPSLWRLVPSPCTVYKEIPNHRTDISLDWRYLLASDWSERRCPWWTLDLSFSSSLCRNGSCPRLGGRWCRPGPNKGWKQRPGSREWWWIMNHGPSRCLLYG